MLAGTGLAMSGAVLQGTFRNPLVGPQIVGVSNGAAFGSVLALLIGTSTMGVVGSAFLFGLLALLFVFGLTRLAGGQGTVTLILAGVVIGAFFSALVGVGQYLADPETRLPGIVYWLLGSFVGATPAKAWLLAAVTLPAGGLLFLLRWRINLLSLDDQDAAALGVRISPLRWLVLVLASLLVAGQVAVSGGNRLGGPGGAPFRPDGRWSRPSRTGSGLRPDGSALPVGDGTIWHGGCRPRRCRSAS